MGDKRHRVLVENKMSLEALSEKEQKLLLHCLCKHRPDLLGRVGELESSSVDENLVNAMRTAIGMEFAGNGYLGDQKSEEYGKRLDALIDKLADLYLWPEEKKQ